MSSILSNSLLTHYSSGKTLIEDSKKSEDSLLVVIRDVIQPYAQSLFDKLEPGWKVVFEQRISSYHCLQFLKQNMDVIRKPSEAMASADTPSETKDYDKTHHNLYDIPDDSVGSYKKSYMKPDGGILFVVNKDGLKYPLIISEDKIQGTNDHLYKLGKKRQATGNAIERAAKNMNMAKTLTVGLSYFPYVVFASGCDFHPSETISMRLVQMNWLFPNNYIDIEHPELSIETQLQKIIQNIDITKKYGFMDVATICIKAHQWNKSPHGASDWTHDERIQICKKIIDQSYSHITKKL
jgi:hypothetical protein